MTARQVRASALVALSAAAAIALALACELLGFGRPERPLFILLVGAVFWYAASGPGVFALALLVPGFMFFFTEPRYSFAVSGDTLGSDVGYMTVFVLGALMLGWFAAKRRHVEHELRTAHEALEKGTAELEAANKELEAFAYSSIPILLRRATSAPPQP